MPIFQQKLLFLLLLLILTISLCNGKPTINEIEEFPLHHEIEIKDPMTISESEITVFNDHEIDDDGSGSAQSTSSHTFGLYGWSTLTICTWIAAITFVLVWVLFWIIFHSESREFQKTQHKYKNADKFKNYDNFRGAPNTRSRNLLWADEIDAPINNLRSSHSIIALQPLSVITEKSRQSEDDPCLV